MAFDIVIRGGTIYDGNGLEPFTGDLALVDDQIVRVGDVGSVEAAMVIDASGLAVAPGFVNVLSHSYATILRDPRSMSELLQGVTTQIFGEGRSMGPMPPHHEPTDEAPWSRLSEYLAYVEQRGTTQNVASLIGAATVRIYAMGPDMRAPEPTELDTMRSIVREEMEDGALGVGSALIYPPGSFADTGELIAICEAAAPFGGIYASHVRNEGAGLVEAIGELLTICRAAGVRGEIWHLKAAGSANWPLMDEAIETIENARGAGDLVGADVYTYTASNTGLTPYVPDRYLEGGLPALFDRLDDPTVRDEILAGVRERALSRRSPDDVLILRLENEDLRHFQGRTLRQAADELKIDPLEAVLELIRLDRSRVGVAYFSMSEDNLRTQIALPWVAFGSDASSVAAEGLALEHPVHPRTYGNFARLLGRYVRDERLITLPETIRRLTSLAAEWFGLARRGRLREGYFADVVVFDPGTIADRSTFEDSHQYAVGVRDVIVNGRVTLLGGEHTGTLAGRALRRRSWLEP